MPIITVSALITDGERLLLSRRKGELEFTLPGGRLTDADETVEDALVRALAESTGLAVAEPEFLDTLYERLPDEVVVHNVFSARAAATDQLSNGRGELEFEWVAIAGLRDMPLPAWLAGALPALLAGEEAPPHIGAADLAAAINREVGVGLDSVAPHATGMVWIITGPAGAGKSSVAVELCRRFSRSALIEVDDVRHMVRSGYASPVPGKADPAEAALQEDLAHRNAAMLAQSFSAAGFDAVIADVLETPEELDRYLAYLDGLSVAFVTLLPDAQTVRVRDRGRSPELSMGERAAELHAIFAANGEMRGLRLDTSRHGVEETVDLILNRRDEALVALPGEWIA